MIQFIRFEEPAYISSHCQGVVFSKDYPVPLDYEEPERHVMERLNSWIAGNRPEKILCIQGPTRYALGRGVGIVSLTLLYED